jgi:hypothetical protein
MTIVPIPLKNSSSVVEFFKQGGKVEIPRPEQCLYAKCGLRQPLRKNGSYARQVIYWGLCFLVQILRFRCRRCGKTTSCPYGWLVPYRRFSAEVIAASIEAYASMEVAYRGVSADLSDLELVEPEMDVREEELYENVFEGGAAKQVGGVDEPPCRPAHTTVFGWVDFACKRTEALLLQLQKELVQERKRGKEIAQLPPEGLVENPNSYKAASDEKDRMLDRLSFAMCTAVQLVTQSKQQWYRLRAYFLIKAETRKDVLTETRVQLPITQTFEPAIF